MFTTKEQIEQKPEKYDFSRAPNPYLRTLGVQLKDGMI